MTNDVDPLVIGGGLAGSMLALRLAAANRRVTLLEKESSPHHKVCGEFLSPEAVHYLHQAGIDPVQLGAATIRALRLSAGSRVVEAALPFSALSLSRKTLDEALLSRAAATPGCTVLRGSPVETVKLNGHSATAQLRGGQSFTAPAVFLATGKHDVRAWHRSPSKQSDMVGFKIHLQLDPAQTEALRGFIEIFLFPHGYGGISLVEGDAANLCFVVRRSALRIQAGFDAILANILQHNQHLRQRLQKATPLWDRPLAISPIPYGYLAKHPRGLWSLGDQAAVIPSFTGDGMSIALHSAALAAQMYLAGETADTYHRILRAQLNRGMMLATLVSRLIVTSPALALAPIVLSFIPPVIKQIAANTRIPRQVLLTTET